MNIAQASVVIRARALLEVVDLAFRFSAGLGGKLYLKLAALYLLPGWVLALLLTHWVEAHPLWVWFFVVVYGSLLQGVFTAAAGLLMFEPQVTVRQVTSRYRERFFAHFGAVLLSWFFMALGGLVVVGFPFAWVRTAFIHEAVILEGARATQASGRSARFIRNNGGWALNLMIVTSTAMVCIALVAEALGQGLLEDVLQLGQPFGALFKQGISPFATLGYLAAIPLIASARFLAYIDSRTRRDGWDVQVRFMAIQAAEGTS